MSSSVLQFDAVSRATIHREPYTYAVIDGLFPSERAHALAATFPTDHYRIVGGGEGKRYRYDARPLIAFGRSEILFPGSLSPIWRTLVNDLASPEYRAALSRLTGIDLSDAPLEVNLFHYGPRSLLEPHCDLPDKILTHVLYFNDVWNPADGGCLRILRSSNADDVVAEIPPIVGSSAILVRSESSWHGVPEVRRGVTRSRRSLTATFYRPGSTSTLFPDDGDYRLISLGQTGSRTFDRVQDFVIRAVRRLRH